MKKPATIIITIFLLCALTGCDPSPRQISDSIVSNVIVSVELIEYDNPSAKRAGTFFSCDSANVKLLKKLSPFDFNKMKVLETLKEGNLDGFLEDFLATKIWTRRVCLDSPIGTCLKLNYENGDFLVLSYGGLYAKGFNLLCKYNMSGTPLLVFYEPADQEAFKEVINKFFETKI